MTESEFNSCTDPQSMLEFLRGKASDRKLRLLVVGCIRSALPPSLKAMMAAANVIERYAEGEMIGTDMVTAYQAHARIHGPNMLVAFCREEAHSFADLGISYIRPLPRLVAALLRDLFGPLPFRPVPIPASVLAWNSGCVVKLATAAYEERALPSGTLDNGRLAILADALEQAGLDNEEVLQHLRQPGGVHVRGCWVVDLVLNKR